MEWPRADLFGYIIKRVELREQPSDGKLLSRSVQRALFFSSRIIRSLSCEFPSGEFKTFLAPISRAPKKTPLPFGLHISFDSIYVGA